MALIKIDTEQHSPVLQSWEIILGRFRNTYDASSETRTSYVRRLRQFILWMNDNDIVNPKRDDVIRYRDHLKDKNFSAATVANYLAAIRCLLSWTEGAGIYPDVAKSVKGVKRPRGFRKDTLTLGQIKELLASIDKSTLKGKRDYALVNLLIRTGLRTIEVARTNIEDMRQHGDETVLWVQGKARDSKDEFVVLTYDTFFPIMEYISARKNAKDIEPLFGSTSRGNLHQRLSTRSIRRAVKQRLRSVGIDSLRYSAHSLRHTCITIALKAGVKIQEVQSMARHLNINTTLVYAHNLKRVEGVAEKAIDRVIESQDFGEQEYGT